MEALTIAIVPRDRFSVAARCLRQLLAVTPPTFRLLIVDCLTPARYREQMQHAVEAYPTVQWLHHADYLPPNAAKNWAVRETQTPWLVLLENDTLVHPGWLENLYTACIETQAEVGRPLLLETRHGLLLPHFAAQLGAIDTQWDVDGPHLQCIPRQTPVTADWQAARQFTTVLETHAVLYRRSALQRIGPFDERLTTRTDFDLALQLFHAQARIVFEPAAVVTYVSPPPVARDEREFYARRWDLEAAERSHHIVQAKWQLATLPSSHEFVRARRYFTSFPRYALYQMKMLPRRLLKR